MEAEAAKACEICEEGFVPPRRFPDKMYCTVKCKNKANRLKRAADPAKVAADNAKREAYWLSDRGREVRALREEKERQRSAARRQAKLEQIDLILEDWVWIGPHVGWSARAAAPRIGVGEDVLIKILRRAREAGDPRGVIPKTYEGMRLYSAA